jgi:hypothetical protein
VDDEEAMSRVDRHGLLSLGGLVTLESLLGLFLRDATWTHAPLFAVDALLGVFVVASALGMPTDGGP